MPDLAPLPPSTAIPGAGAQGAGAIQTVQVAISDLPEVWSDLTRTMQTAGSMIAGDDANTVLLRTAAGTVTLDLSALQKAATADSPSLTEPGTLFASLKASLGAALTGGSSQGESQANNLLGQIKSFLGTTRPVGLVLDPGSPPKTATLILSSKAETPTVKTPASALASLLLPGSLAASSLLTATKVKALVLWTEETASAAPALPPAVASKEGAVHEGTPGAALLTNAASEEPATTAAASSEQPPAAVSAFKTLKNGEAVLLQVAPDTEAEATAKTAARPETLNKTTTLAPENQSVKATVTGRTTDGDLMVKAEGRTILLRLKQDLPVGTKLELTLLARAKEPGPSVLPAQAKPEAALKNVLEILTGLDPEAASRFLNNRILQPTQALPPTLLFFLNALEHGTLETWLGEQGAQQTLEKAGKKNAIAQACAALAEVQENARDPDVGSWRTYPLPLYNDHIFEGARLYVRSRAEQQSDGYGEEGPADAPKKTRFVIDLNLTQLGALQLDGLSKQQELNLIMRSEKALPLGLPATLQDHYTRTLLALGLVGNLHFQTGRAHWINFLSERLTQQRTATRW